MTYGAEEITPIDSLFAKIELPKGVIFDRIVRLQVPGTTIACGYAIHYTPVVYHILYLGHDAVHVIVSAPDYLTSSLGHTHSLPSSLKSKEGEISFIAYRKVEVTPFGVALTANRAMLHGASDAQYYEASITISDEVLSLQLDLIVDNQLHFRVRLLADRALEHERISSAVHLQIATAKRVFKITLDTFFSVVWTAVKREYVRALANIEHFSPPRNDH